MPSLSQRSFAGGEISPRLFARIDQQKYAYGAKTLRNTIVPSDAGTQNRPGTKFVGEQKDPSRQNRMIPFQFSDSQTLVLDFGHQYIRFIQNGAYVSDFYLSITNITNANPAVVTYDFPTSMGSVVVGAWVSGFGYTAGDGVTNGGKLYKALVTHTAGLLFATDLGAGKWIEVPITGSEIAISSIVGAMGDYLNGRNFKISNLNTVAKTFELKYLDGTNVNSTGFGAYTSGGTALNIYELASPFDEDMLYDISYLQENDVIRLAWNGATDLFKELTRTSATVWDIISFSYGGNIGLPTITTINGFAGAKTLSYVVTALDANGNEGAASAQFDLAGAAEPTAANPVEIIWTVAGSWTRFRIYRVLAGVPGFVGESEASGPHNFFDAGYDPDFTQQPIIKKTYTQISALGAYQQRLMLANVDGYQNRVAGSKINEPYLFDYHRTPQDSDGILFGFRHSPAQEVRHFVDIGKLLILTNNAEFVAEGNGAGIITPLEVNPRKISGYGSAKIKPLEIGGSAVIVQARKKNIRDLGFTIEANGYRGNDLTAFAKHLFEGKQIVSWAYQCIPDSIIWAVLDDGTLLGLTYIKEQEIIAWHRHDTDGLITDVCVIPEGDEDVVYLDVTRTINSTTKKYKERLTNRYISEAIIKDTIFMDSAITYDGRNANGSHTMTLSGGTNWDETETLTLTSSASFFKSTDIAARIDITGADGTVIRATIEAYTSGLIVTVRPHRTVPVAMRSVARSTWTKAIKVVKGLWHLEGKTVSILGDGFVDGSPNNSAYTSYVVANGQLTLNGPRGVIHVGLPYISDIETLNLDIIQGESFANKKTQVSELLLYLEKTRGLFVGGAEPSSSTLDGLTELKLRQSENYDQSTLLFTGNDKITIRSEWNSNGRIFIRQVDPLPCSVLGVIVSGYLPVR